MSDLHTQNIMGYHAIIEHKGGISHFSKKQLSSLLAAAALAAGATILNENFHHFGPDMGITGVLLLAESHISIHTWPENGYAAIDIFVCSDRSSINNAIDVIRAADGDGMFSVQIIERVA